MTILSIYVHHEPTSLTGALKNTALSILLKQGHKILESDLYGVGFSPKAEKFDFSFLSGHHFNYMLEQKHAANRDMAFGPDIIEEINKLQEASVIIIHTPIWWQGVPAILKGWFDRVLAMGVAWDSGRIYENGLLKGKSVFLCATIGGPKEYYQLDGKHKATIEQILHPVQHGTFAFCGMNIIEPYYVFNSLGLNEKSAQEVIKDYQFRIEHLIDSPSYIQKYD
jgi:NAD(P)H dehydrogenase (quinone)